MIRDTDLEALLVAKFVVMAPVLDERGRRLWAAAESAALGYGGDSIVSAATGLSRTTVHAGRLELAAGVTTGGRIRRPGAGRPDIEQTQPGVGSLEPAGRAADPRGSDVALAVDVQKCGETGGGVDHTRVARQRHDRRAIAPRVGHRLHALQKAREGAAHPDRNAQFAHINATAGAFIARGQPVISVDTKKKELVGDFKNAGREWQPLGAPERVRVHDFPGDCGGQGDSVRRLRPRNEAWVSVGRDHDTPAFAVASIRQSA